MRSQVKRWGNSASVRIPAPVLAAASLKIDASVEVVARDGGIMIRSVDSEIPTLEEMLDQMTPENFPDPVDWGPPVGKEIW